MGSLFKSTKDWQNDSILYKSRDLWLYYAEGFKLSAELIEKELIDKQEDRDLLIYPLLYLYRHYIELKCKEVIAVGKEILGTENYLPKGGHDLMTLWTNAHNTLKAVWKDGYTKPKGSIVAKVKEFHKTDLKSDEFRYPVDKDGRNSLAQIERINYRNFRDEFAEVKQYLEEIADGIYAVKDN